MLFIFYEVKTELKRCMGIPFITEEQLLEKAVQPVELGNIVLLEDKVTAFDKNQKRIYLPCRVDETTKFYELEGKLKSALPEYDLYFLWESSFDIMSEAVKYGCVFTLYAIDESGNYAAYSVNFTTLPIIEMQGEVIKIDEREREIYSGELTVWDPSYQETGHLKAEKSRLEWHERGYSSMSFLKKSLKLNLKKKNGENNNLSILGFESDDDYILNPMWFDDVKVREKLAMDLWNEIAEQKGSPLKMSGGAYCELIINGEYQGLRLMQNKIEKSYLKLKKDDTLLKGKNVNLGTVKPPEEVYEIIYSTQDTETTYQTISDFFYETDFSNVNLNDWVDLQLFLQLGNMKDNEVYKNIYYVIQRDHGKESLSFVPWDTDMSFGVYWEDGFRYMPESVEYVTYRKEYEALSDQCPEVDSMLSDRWKELRDSVFKKENILGKVDTYYTTAYNSGAISRDFNYLGWYSWGDEDTLDKLVSYIEKRLEVLDNLYGYKNTDVYGAF